MRVDTARSNAEGFTLIELLVVISIIALLISILLPTLRNAREAALTTQCLANMRQISIGTVGYISDYNNYFPAKWSWASGLSGVRDNGTSVGAEYVAPWLVHHTRNWRGEYQCPGFQSLGSPEPNRGGYFHNGDGLYEGAYGDESNGIIKGQTPVLADAVERPSWMILDYDDWKEHPTQHWTTNNWLRIGTGTHESGRSMTYADGHAEHRKDFVDLWSWDSSVRNAIFRGQRQAPDP